MQRNVSRSSKISDELESSPMETGRVIFFPRLSDMRSSGNSDNQRSLSVSVVLSDGFSMLSLGAITDTLALASRHAGSSAVMKRLLGLPSLQLISRSGVRVTADQTLDGIDCEADLVRDCDGLFLCMGDSLTAEQTQAVLRLVRRAKRNGKPICLFGAVVRVAAENGLLESCTDHWSRVSSLRETAPNVSIADTIFIRDGHIVTSPGEAAALDLMISLISERLGRDIACEVSAQLLIEAVRNGSRPQPRFAANRFRGIPRAVTTAIDMFEANIESPPSPSEVAERVGISVRQLERMFAKHLGIAPHKFCRHAQLQHATRLLEQTSMEVVEIALACGFRETVTFNKRFKLTYGRTPTEYRQLK